MQEPVFNYITATFGISFAAALAVIIIAFWGVYIVTKKTVEIQKDHSLLSGNHEMLNNNIDEIRRDLSYLKGSIDILRTPGGLIQSHSPISLTEQGRQVATELNANRLLDQNWATIKEVICSKNLSTQYDIQQYCIETASVDPQMFFDDTTINAVKNYAYEKGKPVQLYLRVLGVLIRDRYLQEEADK